MVEPPIGIEPMTYALREAREHAAGALPAQTARRTAPEAPIALNFCGYPFHAPFHATSLQTTVSSGLGSSADGKGEEGIDRSFERTRIPKYLGE